MSGEPSSPQPAVKPGRGRRTVVLICIICLAFGIGFAGLMAYQSFAPGPLAAETTVLVPKGSGVGTIAHQLQQRGIIKNPLLFRILARLQGLDKRLHAGEYALTPHVSTAQIITTLASGKTVQRSLTIPEGWSSAEIVALLKERPDLTGEITDIPPEGSLLPETYFYTYSDTRQSLLQRMQEKMEEARQSLWPKHAESHYLKSWEEVVILASIVEKETGVSEEREQVASVFFNRLERNMPLQSDPTTVYAITKGERPLGRGLTYADLAIESPYNTYKVRGLPKGPICNPGLASLQAVLTPDTTDYLYFVANGTGGHTFARTLNEHKRNVRVWRQIQGRE